MNWYRKYVVKVATIQDENFPFGSFNDEDEEAFPEETTQSTIPVFISSDEYGTVVFRAHDGGKYMFRGSTDDFVNKVRGQLKYPGRAFNYAINNSSMGWHVDSEGNYRNLMKGKE